MTPQDQRDALEARIATLRRRVEAKAGKPGVNELRGKLQAAVHEWMGLVYG